jgi:hypothetical protein
MSAALLVATFNAAHAQQWGYASELQEFLQPLPPSSPDVKPAPFAPLVLNAREIANRGLMKAQLAETPWSSDFWADVKGSIADPYIETRKGPLQRNRALWSADTAAAKVGNIFVRENRPALIARSEMRKDLNALSDAKIDNFSPSEKYDMLMGDADFTMTKNVVNMVDVRAKYDLVALFSGVCHGWAPASLTVPRPQHAVTLMTPFGRPVTFYPHDIKALSTFLWGKSQSQSQLRVNGWKCQTGGQQDARGRSSDPRCFNANPAFLHLVAANQMGLNKRGFIFDKSFSETVWNHPVYRYEFKFFNVTDRSPYTGLSFEEAKAVVTPGMRDPFRQYRAPGTKAIVGVYATVYFSVENRDPDHSRTDDPSKDKTDKMHLRYDLELDANDQIIGGEWREYENPFKPNISETRAYTHPSIIWIAPAGMKVTSPADWQIQGTKWDGKGIAPAAWRKAALDASNAKEYQPVEGKNVEIPSPQALGGVVDLLVELSRK